MNVDVLVHTINTLAQLLQTLSNIAKEDPQAWEQVKGKYADALETYEELVNADKRV